MGPLTSPTGNARNVKCDLPGKSNVKNKEATLGRLIKEAENGHSPFIFPQQISLRSLYSCKLHLSLADKRIEYSVALVVGGSKFIQTRSRALEKEQ